MRIRKKSAKRRKPKEFASNSRRVANAKKAKTASSSTLRRITSPAVVAMVRSQSRETMEDNSPRRRKSESKTLDSATSSRKEKSAPTIIANSRMKNLCRSHPHTRRLLTDKSTKLRGATSQMAKGRNEPNDIFRTI